MNKKVALHRLSMNAIALAAILTLGLVPPPLRGLSDPATLRVPLDFPTIQGAIDAAMPGDTVRVSSGTYTENLNFRGKAIEVVSEAGAESTIVDGGAAGPVVTFRSGEGPGSMLRGFTLRNGRSGLDGGGILIASASPVIERNVIESNTACNGAGIAVSFGSPKIIGNVIRNNSRSGCSGGIGGGGIELGGAGSAQILDNVIEDNHIGDGSGGGIALFAVGTPTISGNVIVNNTTDFQGGGLHFANYSDASVVQNIIAGNAAGWGGGIYWLVPSGARGPRLVNNTIVGNLSPNGSAVFADGFDVSTALYNNLIIASLGQTALFCGNFNDTNPPILRSNDVYSAEGAAYGGICSDQTGNNGNLSVDPMLRDPAGGDLHPVAGSAVVDRGDNSAPDLPDEDLDGNDRVVDGDGDGTAVVDLGAFEAGPVIPETYLVDTTGDDDGTCDESPCSLREAINAANSHPGADTIAFGIPGDRPFTIQPEFALPNITDPVTIDGTTQKGWTIGAPVVELSGVKTPADVSGLLIEAGLSVVRGLIVNGYRGGGIMLIRNGGNVLEGNFIGTNSEGTEAVGNSVGVWVGDHTTGNTIGGVTAEARNIISGNNGDGVSINESTSGTVVEGNYIGTDASGLAPLPNTSNGVVLVMGTTDNVIGGTQDDAGNVISANTGSGVDIADEGTSRNVVEGNFIGTDATGGLPLGNGGAGIDVRNGASGNTVGGIAGRVRNVISDNVGDGVSINGVSDNGVSTTGNFVLGNYIGTDVGGTTAMPNQGAGVRIGNGASANTVGGDSPEARNIISGNAGQGIVISDSGTNQNAVQGNFIGTDVTGAAALGNLDIGVFIFGEAADNVVGGIESGMGNLVSGNGGSGVNITDGDRNSVLGNRIGTDASGNASVANLGNGVVLDGGATDNVVGGSGPAAANVIAGNGANGIWIFNPGTSGNRVSGNLIGTDVTGALAVGNSNSGIMIGDQASENLIGGTEPGAGNLISGNAENGISIFNPGTNGNIVQGNYIGTDATGMGQIGNSAFGIVIGEQASENLVGGTETGAGNLISGNAWDGIAIFSSGTNGNMVQGNLIGTNLDGSEAMGNGCGIWIGDGATNSTIGGTEAGARNVISGNNGDGISINGPASGTVVQGNLIGTDPSGVISLPNQANGVILVTGTYGNSIGGAASGAGNLISGNVGDGVAIVDLETHGNGVQGNRIGTDLAGTAPLPNGGNGVIFAGGTHHNLIGGSEEGAGNLISDNAGGGVGIADSPDNAVERNVIYGNVFSGVWIWGAGSTGNTVHGNLIGTDPGGTEGLGNGRGVWIGGEAAGNAIGGTEPGDGNTIAFNAAQGIAAASDAGAGNAILGNAIHDNADLAIDLAEDGVTPNDPRDRDSGPNDLQNFPVLSPPILFHGSLKVAGVLWSKPNATYRIEFFEVTTCDPSGYGEGDAFLGFKDVTTGPWGFAAFVFQLPPGFEPRGSVTATATDPAGSTSEFSRCSGRARIVGGGR